MPSLTNALSGVGKWAGAVHGFGKVLGQMGQASPLVQAVAQTGMAVAGAAGGAAAGTTTGAAAGATLGKLAAATAGLVVSFGGLMVAAEKLSRSWLESQRHLSQVSPEMAAVFARSDVNRMLRDMKTGSDTSGTAEFLSRSLDRLTDTIRPFEVLLVNTANSTLGALTGLLELSVRGQSDLIELFNQGLQKLEELIRGQKKDATIGVSEWMSQISEDVANARSRNDRLFRRLALE